MGGCEGERATRDGADGATAAAAGLLLRLTRARRSCASGGHQGTPPPLAPPPPPPAHAHSFPEPLRPPPPATHALVTTIEGHVGGGVWCRGGDEPSEAAGH